MKLQSVHSTLFIISFYDSNTFIKQNNKKTFFDVQGNYMQSVTVKNNNSLTTIDIQTVHPLKYSSQINMCL